MSLRNSNYLELEQAYFIVYWLIEAYSLQKKKLSLTHFFDIFATGLRLCYQNVQRNRWGKFYRTQPAVCTEVTKNKVATSALLQHSSKKLGQRSLRMSFSFQNFFENTWFDEQAYTGPIICNLLHQSITSIQEMNSVWWLRLVVGVGGGGQRKHPQA